MHPGAHAAGSHVSVVLQTTPDSDGTQNNGSPHTLQPDGQSLGVHTCVFGHPAVAASAVTGVAQNTPGSPSEFNGQRRQPGGHALAAQAETGQTTNTSDVGS
jgi:hypothetical protein